MESPAKPSTLQQQRLIATLILIIVLAALGVFSYFQAKKLSAPSSNQAITLLGSQAFGELSLNASAARSAATTDAKLELSAPESKAIGKTEPSTLIPPVTSYHFVYAGMPLSQPETSVNVLRPTRSKGSDKFSDLLNNAGFTVGNSSPLRKGLAQTITIKDQNEEYHADIDLVKGVLSISLNSAFDAAVSRSSSNQAENNPQLSNEETLSIADSFLSRFGISATTYGKPWVQDQSSSLATVVYPITVNNLPIYDISGNLYGLRITVDASTKKVTSLQNARTIKAEASAYPAETDTNILLEIASTGGIQQFWQQGENVQEISLDTPIKGYVLNTIYKETEEELLIPALIFPVKPSNTSQTLGLSSVIVPLAKGALQSSFIEGTRPVPMPVPMLDHVH